eukprot:SAG25_NODE_142_length_14075_cov_38.666070_8_plen_192_part_00
MLIAQGSGISLQVSRSDWYEANIATLQLYRAAPDDLVVDLDANTLCIGNAVPHTLDSFLRDLMLIIIIRDHTPIIIIRDLYNDHYHTRSRIMELGSWNIIIREHISNHTSPPVMPTIFATSVALHASINHHFPDLESQSFHVNQPDKHCISSTGAHVVFELVLDLLSCQSVPHEQVLRTPVLLLYWAVITG